MKFIVIGGGIAGLLSADLLRSKYPNAQIKLIESSPYTGGVLRGIYYKNQEVYFDIGTHIFQETSIKEIDQIMIESIGEDHLIHYPVGQGDIAGALFNNQIQNNSPFPDLRNHVLYEYLSNDIRENIKNSDICDVSNIQRDMAVEVIARKRFGSAYTDSVIIPMLENMYMLPPENLSFFSMVLPSLTRVIIDDYSEWICQLRNEKYKSIIAVPNQLELPSDLQHTRRSYYSKTLGSRSLILGMENRLHLKSVEILTNTKVLNINLDGKNLQYFHEGKVHSVNFDGLVIATGVFSAASLLKMDMDSTRFEKPMKHYLINILLDRPSLSDLFYFYGLDTCCEWYRITNYKAFSNQPNDLRISLEIIGREIESPKEFVAKILAQLYNAGFLESESIRFFDIVNLPSGFPKPTVKNISNLKLLSSKISSMLPKNVLLAGVGARNNNFFQSEVMIDAFEQVNMSF